LSDRGAAEVRALVSNAPSGKIEQFGRPAYLDVEKELKTAHKRNSMNVI